MTITAYTFC